MIFDFGLVHHSRHCAACRCHRMPRTFLARECPTSHHASVKFGGFHRMSSRSSPDCQEGPCSGSVTVHRIASPVLGHRYDPAGCPGLPCLGVPQSGPAGARKYPWPWRGRNAAAVAGAVPGGTDTRSAARRSAEGRRVAGTRPAPAPRRPASRARRAAARGTGSEPASAAGWAGSWPPGRGQAK